MKKNNIIFIFILLLFIGITIPSYASTIEEDDTIKNSTIDVIPFDSTNNFKLSGNAIFKNSLLTDFNGAFSFAYKCDDESVSTGISGNLNLSSNNNTNKDLYSLKSFSIGVNNLGNYTEFKNEVGKLDVNSFKNLSDIRYGVSIFNDEDTNEQFVLGHFVAKYNNQDVYGTLQGKMIDDIGVIKYSIWLDNSFLSGNLNISNHTIKN